MRFLLERRICVHPEGQWMPVPALLPALRVSSSRQSWSPLRWHECTHSLLAQPRHRGFRSAVGSVLPILPRSPAEAERSRFLPQTAPGARALPAELQMLSGAGTAGRDLAEAALAGCGSGSGRDGIKEREQQQHLPVPSAATPPLWRGARHRHLAVKPPRAGRECREEHGVLVTVPFPRGDRHCARRGGSGARNTPGAGRGGRRPTWRIPLSPIVPGWKPGPLYA